MVPAPVVLGGSLLASWPYVAHVTHHQLGRGQPLLIPAPVTLGIVPASGPYVAPFAPRRHGQRFPLVVSGGLPAGGPCDAHVTHRRHGRGQRLVIPAPVVVRSLPTN
jgi:hypothetical protein